MLWLLLALRLHSNHNSDVFHVEADNVLFHKVCSYSTQADGHSSAAHTHVLE